MRRLMARQKYLLVLMFFPPVIVVIVASYKVKLATVDLRSFVFFRHFSTIPPATLNAAPPPTPHPHSVLPDTCLLYGLTTMNGHLCLCLSFPFNICWFSLCLDKPLPHYIATHGRSYFIF